MKYRAIGLLVVAWLSAGGQATAAGIERLEPPFWWQGFNDTGLQILVYGNDIGRLTPSVSHDGITLLRTVRVSNPNYLFLYLDIDSAVEPGYFQLEFSGAGEALTRSYELRRKNPDPAHARGYSNADAIYLVTPDRFANGDPGNDNIEALGDFVDRDGWQARHGGDLAGLRQHLDYIAAMGFTALWLNPVLENAMPRASYHGYATTDFYQVDPRFGSNEEYRELVAVARQKGIGVIMDMIANHCGLGHWWMNDLPSADWINHGGRFAPTSHERTAIHDPYAAQSDIEDFASGWFVPAMPDLNQRNPLLADYLVQNTLWWIEYLGLAGIRQDTYPYPDAAFMTEWTRRVIDEYPQFNMVGEQWSVDPVVVSYWQRGKHNKDGYVSYLPELMDFPLQHALHRALTGEDTWESGWVHLYRMLANDVVYANPYDLVVFADNHDMSRIYTQLDEDFAAWKMAMVFLATTRGTPQIYYGTEILMTNRGSDDHGLIRSDFPGGWPGDPVNAFTGKGLSPQQRDAQQFLRTLLNWRKTQPVIATGRLTHYRPRDGVYVYFRHDTDSKIMVALNKNTAATELDPDRFEEMLGGHTSARDVFSNKTRKPADTLRVPARGVLLLEID